MLTLKLGDTISLRGKVGDLSWGKTAPVVLEGQQSKTLIVKVKDNENVEIEGRGIWMAKSIRIAAPELEEACR